MTHKATTKAKKHSDRVKRLNAPKEIFLGVVNHCTEPNGKVHFHLFWDFDNCDELDFFFAVKDLVEQGYDVLPIESSPRHYHLILLNPLTESEVRHLERWIKDDLGADYLGMEATDLIEGCSGATLRLSEKDGWTPLVLDGAFGPNELPICAGILALYRQSCLKDIRVVVSKPTLVLYQSRKRV